MPVLKPVRGIQLNKSHPLARGLVGYWLLNEGSGNKVFDLSGWDNALLFDETPDWLPGQTGSSVRCNGTDESLYINDTQSQRVSEFTLIVKAYFHETPTSNDRFFEKEYDNAGSQPYVSWGFECLDSGTLRLLAARTDVAPNNRLDLASGITVDSWDVFAGVYSQSSGFYIYKNGILEASDNTKTGPISYYSATGNQVDIFGRLNTGNYVQASIEYAFFYNHALSASEIALLYREPFCMFDRAWRPKLIGGQIVELAGTSMALSSLSAIAKASRKVGGTAAGTSDVTAVLSSIRLHHIEKNWLRGALFNGMTANAFKLGTSLSLGWFWVRVTGCSALYRGESPSAVIEAHRSALGVDFTNILVVFNLDTSDGSRATISPPSYIPHNSDSTYFYVVRRFNNCGYQEHTSAAAVKVSIKSNGELAEPQPNNISSSKVEQVAGNKVRLTWFYCPLEQSSEPVSFNVYYDERTGQIDYFDPLAIIEYKWRKFYSFQSSTLEAGGYLLAIRAEDAGGIENISLARLKIQLDTLNPDAIDILRVEAV